MATFTKYKGNDNKVLYRQGGSGSSVRFVTKGFNRVPDSLEINLPDGYEFVVTSGGGFSKTPMPPDIAEAAQKLAQFRAAEKAKREAALTPEQRAKREAKKAEKAAKKQTAAPAPPKAVPAVAPGRTPKAAGR